MLEVGNGGMSIAEYQSEFSLWAEMAAPLIAGNDLTKMSAITKSILTNQAIIAVDQDPLGRQGYPVSSAGGHWVLTKPLANGHRAVVLFNQTSTAAIISTTATLIGLGSAAEYSKVDLWTGTMTETTGTITADVPAHGAVFFEIVEIVAPPFTS
jgi:alpha-galactosidase